jgi:4-diphosphocytidyl-2-C-methyl-D-erythritol kinase
MNFARMGIWSCKTRGIMSPVRSRRLLAQIQCEFVTATIPSCAKINLGLRIGRSREDGFHELRTVYQTIGLHDMVSVSVQRGSGIEIRCQDPRVPSDSTNTCFRIVERAVQTLKVRARIVVEIGKRLPVQGGLGGASGNAVAALLALERSLRKKLPAAERLQIAAEVGSDIPLFLIGGTVLGVGRGEEVYPLPDLPPTTCVIALPDIPISTPKAFVDWDEEAKLTPSTHSDRMLQFSREISAWLNAVPSTSVRRSGVSARGGGRAENPLLDLVRTGIENDFERVVFPKYPELLEVKRVLEKTGAKYASLSGSGSAIYGLFDSQQKAAVAAKKLIQQGTRALVTSTLTRRQYWKKLSAASY